VILNLSKTQGITMFIITEDNEYKSRISMFNEYLSLYVKVSALHNHEFSNLINKISKVKGQVTDTSSPSK